MADHANITRRSALTTLAAIPAMGTAAIVPAKAESIESPADLLERLAEEMAFALDAWIDGMATEGLPRPDWDAVVAPTSTGRGCHFMNRKGSRKTPDERIDAAIAEIQSAMAELYPGWTVQHRNDAVHDVYYTRDGSKDMGVGRHAVLIYASPQSYGPEEVRWFKVPKDEKILTDDA